MNYNLKFGKLSKSGNESDDIWDFLSPFNRGSCRNSNENGVDWAQLPWRCYAIDFAKVEPRPIFELPSCYPDKCSQPACFMFFRPSQSRRVKTPHWQVSKESFPVPCPHCGSAQLNWCLQDGIFDGYPFDLVAALVASQANKRPDRGGEQGQEHACQATMLVRDCYQLWWTPLLHLY